MKTIRIKKQSNLNQLKKTRSLDPAKLNVIKGGSTEAPGGLCIVENVI